MRRRTGLAWLGLALSGLAWGGEAPAIMLAQVYRPGRSLDGFWLSEKYDGLRARWDGRQLLTRGGEAIAAPAWFTRAWPSTPIDGELWAGRGRFEEALSTVRQQQPNDEAWRRLRFMVFDLPEHPGTFTERIQAYGVLVQSLAQPWVQAVAQDRVASHAALMARLDAVVKAGGEGLMLHHGDALYRTLRSEQLLKVKTHEDAEARVVGHVPGRGRHAGRLGALVLEMPDGQRFRLGTGFTDAQREQPPALGQLVTYRYRGLSESGLPRFASFVRVRDEALLR